MGKNRENKGLQKEKLDVYWDCQRELMSQWNQTHISKTLTMKVLLSIKNK